MKRPIHTHAAHGTPETVEELLRQNADVNACNVPIYITLPPAILNTKFQSSIFAIGILG